MSCLAHAAQLGRMKDELERHNAIAIVIGGGTELAATLATRWLKLPWPILRDPERAAYRAYGLDRSLGLIQQSGTMVVDAEGILRYAHGGLNPQAAFPRDQVLAALA